jgi:hypothetical protein
VEEHLSCKLAVLSSNSSTANTTNEMSTSFIISAFVVLLGKLCACVYKYSMKIGQVYHLRGWILQCGRLASQLYDLRQLILKCNFLICKMETVILTTLPECIKFIRTCKLLRTVVGKFKHDTCTVISIKIVLMNELIYNLKNI